MGKMKEIDLIMDAKFLFILRDGRSRAGMEIARLMHVTISPTTQMYIDKIAERLIKRNLIKSTWGGYQITDAGWAWLRTEGLQYAATLSLMESKKKGCLW